MEKIKEKEECEIYDDGFKNIGTIPESGVTHNPLIASGILHNQKTTHHERETSCKCIVLFDKFKFKIKSNQISKQGTVK